MSLTDFILICATILGPVFAVQAQKFLERGHEKDGRRLAIFRTLMATRAAPLSTVHVEALNAIPVDFYGKESSLKEINEAWQLYFDHLNVKPIDEVWMDRRKVLFIDPLYLLAKFLRYSFSKAELQRNIYSPTAHGDLEEDQTMIRRGLVKLLKGEINLPLAIREVPHTSNE